MFQPEQERIPFSGKRCFPAPQQMLDGGHLFCIRAWQYLWYGPADHRRIEPGGHRKKRIWHPMGAERCLPAVIIVTCLHHRQQQQIAFHHAGAVQHQLSVIGVIGVSGVSLIRPDKQAARAIIIAIEIVPQHQPPKPGGRHRTIAGVKRGVTCHNMCAAMKHRHIIGQGGGQLLIMACCLTGQPTGNLAGNLIRIDPWHEAERHTDLAGQPYGNLAMALRLAAAKPGKCFRLWLDIVKHQDNAVRARVNKLI